MILNTFQHLNRVGKKTEERLWKAGIHDWESFINNPRPPVTKALHERLKQDLNLSFKAYESRQGRFFEEKLPNKEHWRLYRWLRDKIAYLDIETTGISPWESEITTIAVYDGSDVHTFVNGQNLDSFPDFLQRFELLVTYNGRGFDVPFIERFFGIEVTQPNIDLMSVLHGLGIRGGLKGSEEKMGLSRGELTGVDGYFAVILWRDYQRTGRQQTLDTLLAYNVEDVVNLEPLLIRAHNLLSTQTPFAESLHLEEPPRPVTPFLADQETIARLQSQQQRGWAY